MVSGQFEQGISKSVVVYGSARYFDEISCVLRN